MIRHEIPTHLSVEDRALLGLTLRQVMYLIVGAAASYALWTHLAEWPSVPPPVRLTVAALCFLTAAGIALLHPYGRGLGEWLLAAIRYGVATRRSVWCSRGPDVLAWAPAADPSWQEIAPGLSWSSPSSPARHTAETRPSGLPGDAEGRS
ncbi:MAG: PrgI family protein [Chloroflexota bacterium]